MLDRATVEDRYQDVSLDVVRDILANRLDDLLTNARAIRARLTL
jgi:hypothetical protein